MDYNPVAGWQNQTLQYVGNSALYLNEEQAGAPAVVVTLECVFYPADKIFLNHEWHPDKGMWGRLTTAHRGFMVSDRLLHYPKTQLLRHFDLVTKMRLALQAEHVAILNYLDEGALDLTEPTSWMDFILDTVFGPAGNSLYGTSDQTVGAYPTEFRLAAHPQSEWEWNVWWQEWDDVVMNLDPPLPPAGEPGPDEPSPPDEPPAEPDDIPNDPVPPDYFEGDFGPQAEPTPPPPEYPPPGATEYTLYVVHGPGMNELPVNPPRSSEDYPLNVVTTSTHVRFFVPAGFSIYSLPKDETVNSRDYYVSHSIHWSDGTVEPGTAP